jgi:hypothetical protein
MSIHSNRKPAAAFILLAFSMMIMFNGYEYGQSPSETPLARAQELMNKGLYDEAVGVLQGYIGEIKDIAEQKPNTASAYYLLAKIYYEVGDDTLCDEALLKVYTTQPGFDRDESNFGLKERITKAKAKLAGSTPVSAETAKAQNVSISTDPKIGEPIPEPEKKEEKPAAADSPGKDKTAGSVLATSISKSGTEPASVPVENKTAQPQPAVVKPATADKPDTTAMETKAKTTTIAIDSKSASAQPAKTEPASIEKPKKDTTTVQKKKKKFPWLWVIGGAVVAGVLIYFFVIKKPKFKLSVTLGTGISGTPSSGSFSYKKGTVVNYNYNLQNGFKNPVILVDGVELVRLSGSLTMNEDHSLEVRAVPLDNFTLTVTKGTGVDGLPNTGTYSYVEGSSVDYNYYVQSGYRNLKVKIDGTLISGNGETVRSGSILMNSNHTLDVQAELGPVEVNYYNLSASADNYLRYTIFVPPGKTSLTIQLYPGSGAFGDADLCVRLGAPPTFSVYDFGSFYGGLTPDTVVISNPASGTWHIGIYAFETFAYWNLYIKYE